MNYFDLWPFLELGFIFPWNLWDTGYTSEGRGSGAGLRAGAHPDQVANPTSASGVSHCVKDVNN